MYELNQRIALLGTIHIDEERKENGSNQEDADDELCKYSELHVRCMHYIFLCFVLLLYHSLKEGGMW